MTVGCQPFEAGEVAFLGLGAMGMPMATRVANRFATTVYSRSPRPFAHGRVASTPRECAVGAELVVTMLADGAALEAVLAGADGVLAGLSDGALVVDMSTVGRKAALAAARAVEAAGGRFVDAPVSGTVKPAERGELVALVGASAADLARAEPLLRAMCSRIVHAGDVGQGQALKVVLNGVGAHHLVAFTSMLALGERAGLSREVLVDAFTQGAFATPSYVGKRPRVLSRNYDAPDFSLALTKKDVDLCVALQDEVGMPLAVHRAIAREVDAGIDEGLGQLDLFALERHFSRE